MSASAMLHRLLPVSSLRSIQTKINRQSGVGGYACALAWNDARATDEWGRGIA